MDSHKPANVTEESAEYRGGLTYRQEYGYKMVTMSVSVAPDEQSHVSTHLHNHPVSEQAERLQGGVDLYHFPVTDGTQIQLTISSPADSREAWYSVNQDGVTAEGNSLGFDIGRSSEGYAYDPAHTQEALHEALTHYADQIPHWLNQAPEHDTLHDRDFGR